MTSADIAAEALAYARAGGLVFPLHTPTAAGCSCRDRECRSVGKHPRNIHGLSEATNDVDQVQQWWAMWPTASIGLRPALGHIVVDIDRRHGGHVQFVAMQQRHGVLPDTLTAITGNGWHVWLTSQATRPRQKLAPGIDIKSHATGYVVAPPSLHQSGVEYVWSRRLPIAAAPNYLTRLVQRVDLAPAASGERGQATEKMLAGWAQFLSEATEGERNARLYWVCARAHEHHADVALFIDIAVTLGLPRTAAEATATSATNAPPRHVMAGAR